MEQSERPQQQMDSARETSTPLSTDETTPEPVTLPVLSPSAETVAASSAMVEVGVGMVPDSAEAATESVVVVEANESAPPVAEDTSTAPEAVVAAEFAAEADEPIVAAEAAPAAPDESDGSAESSTLAAAPAEITDAAATRAAASAPPKDSAVEPAGEPAPDAPHAPLPAAPRPPRLPVWHVAAWHVAAWHLSLPRIPRRVVLLVMLILILVLAGAGALEGVDAAGQARQARHLAVDGVGHLEHIRALVDPNQPATLLDSATLRKAQSDLTFAQRDFSALRTMLTQPHGSLALGSHLPWAGSLLSSTAALAAAAEEACQGGLALLQGGQIAARVAQGGALASSAKPPPNTLPLNTATLTSLRVSLALGMAHLNRAVTYAGQANLSALPSWVLKPSQQTELRKLLARWPQIQDTYEQAQAVMGALPSVLGLNGPSRYLIELMDRTELRAGGGFVGNYAVMTIQEGKVQPFSLTDTYLLDRPYLAKHPKGVSVPSQYAWWPWASLFGLRDSNLSPDFPTSAKLGMQQLSREGGPPVQGVIALTPAAIEGILHIIGPVSVPQYRQVVTEHNLEHLIHFYQEIPANNNPLVDLPPSEQISSPSKRFTALLGQAFMEKLHGLTLDKEIAIGKQMLENVHTKDIQIYLSDPRAEALLTNYHSDSALPQSPDDGVTVVDSNVTPSKGSQFMTILTKDAVTLDSTGTATHQVTITYQFKVTNPAELYGPSYYRSYLRVYAPASAQLISQNGLTNRDGHDQINHSDLSGHQMWGGYVIIQNGHPYTLHFTWKVPKAATLTPHGQHAYTVVYSRQAGAQQRLDVSVTGPGKPAPVVKYSGSLQADKSLSLSY